METGYNYYPLGRPFIFSGETDYQNKYQAPYHIPHPALPGAKR
jgi:hypothetical protein